MYLIECTLHSHKQNKFEEDTKNETSMENFDWIFASFPHIGKQIFFYVDIWTLVKARRVCSSWKTFLDDEMSNYICSELIGGCLRRIDDSRIRREWANFLQEILEGKNKQDIKALLDIMKKYYHIKAETLLCTPGVLTPGPDFCNCTHNSPLHIAVQCGYLSLIHI